MSLFHRPSKPKHSGPMFVKCPPDRIVVPLCDPQFYSVIKLHWLEGNNGSFPCMGAECKLCPAYSFEFTYAPGLVWMKRNQRWAEGILCLGHPNGTLVQEKLTGVPVIMGKDREDKDATKGRIMFYGKANDPRLPAPPPKKAFSVEAHLLRRWGLFKEADLIGCEFHDAQPELFMPEQNAG